MCLGGINNHFEFFKTSKRQNKADHKSRLPLLNYTRGVWDSGLSARHIFVMARRDDAYIVVLLQGVSTRPWRKQACTRPKSQSLRVYHQLIGYIADTTGATICRRVILLTRYVEIALNERHASLRPSSPYVGFPFENVK